MKHLPLPASQPLSLLQRILDSPRLVEQIQQLDAPRLQRLIHHIGLEDSAEIIALATTEQLVQIFDADLWKSTAPGQSEAFDAERFALWLQVMLDMGAPLAAQKITEMDPDFIAMAFSKHTLVLPAAELRMRFQESGDDSEETLVLDKLFESHLNHEFSDYWLLAKNDASWDALLGILVELEHRNMDFFQTLMKRLARISADLIDEQRDIYDALTAGEQLDSDVSEARDMRREAAGFVTPAQAAHFFRAARERWVPPPSPAPVPPPAAASRRKPPAPAAAHAPWAEWLRQEHPLPDDPSAGLQISGSPGEGEAWPLRQALAQMGQTHSELQAERVQELAALANQLMAGCALQGRPFRPAEAAQAAVAVANLGLETLAARTPGPARPPAAWLQAYAVTDLFKLGWSELYHEVVMYVGACLREALAQAPSQKGRFKGKAWIQTQLETLREELSREWTRGTPWRVQDQLLLLETLWESPEVDKLMRAMDECPTLRPAGAPSSAAPCAFIHTPAQIRELRAWAGNLSRRWAKG